MLRWERDALIIGVAAACLGCGFDTGGNGTAAQSESSGTAPGSASATGVPTETTTSTSSDPSLTGSAASSAGPTTAASTTTSPASTTEPATTGTDDSGPGLWTEVQLLRVSAAAAGLTLTEAVEQPPILVHLTPDRFDYTLAKPDGTDLRFFDNATATQLAHEIDRWTVSGNSFIWVKIPRLEPDVPRSITMQYGNPTASDQEDAAGVWSDEFVAVWHLGDGCDGKNEADMLDSTGNGRHGRCVGLQSANVGGGLIGDAPLFENVLHTIEVLDNAAFNFQAEFTLEAWVSISDAELRNNVERLAIERSGSYQLAATREGGNRGPRLSATFDRDLVTVELNSPGADWHYYVGALVEGTMEETCLLVDGPRGLAGCRRSQPTLTMTDAPLNLGVGLVGQIDEVRLSAVRRSDDWISLQYASVSDLLIAYE